jgi:two-component system LytT family sensor kinase
MRPELKNAVAAPGKFAILLNRGERERKVKTLIKLKGRRRLFWTLHTTGWLFYLAFISIADWTMGSLNATVFIGYALSVVAAFLVTLTIRFFYRAIKIQDHSIFSLSIRALLFSFAGAHIMIGISILIDRVFPGPLLHATMLITYLAMVITWLGMILGWSALYFGIKFWQEWALQKEKAEKAKALAQTAQLQMLRYRMNPHFLFNALNSIRALISENKASAKSMVTELSEYLRYSLVSKDYERVPFKEEADSVRHYFNIQKTRYENKLEVSFDIDPEAEEYPIASFLLHPLIENAVKFGMSTSPLLLKIQVNAGVQNGILRVDVINSGSWVEPSEQDREGLIGQSLDNLRQRLAEAYPGKHHFEIQEREGTVQAQLAIGTDIQR